MERRFASDGRGGPGYARRMAKPLPARGEIARCLEEAQRPLHARELATRLGVDEASYSRLLTLLDQLSLDGTVKPISGQRFKAQKRPESGGSTWEGMLSVHPRGFGFVAAVGHDDVYIAPDGIGGAMHGDRVQVTPIGRTGQLMPAIREPLLVQALVTGGEHSTAPEIAHESCRIVSRHDRQAADVMHQHRRHGIRRHLVGECHQWLASAGLQE